MINLANIIYFTKEDGQNKMLMTSNISDDDAAALEHFDQNDYKACTKILGHKPTNVYMFIKGHEFKVLRAWIK